MDSNELNQTLVAEVPTGTPSLADVTARIEGLHFENPTRSRDLLSVMRRCGGFFSLPLAQIPADRRWLRARFSMVRPYRDGINAKTLSNIRSALNDALTLAGVQRLSTRAPAELPPAWQALRTKIAGTQLTIGFDKVASFCADRGIEPDQLDQGIFDEIMAALDATSVSKRPRAVAQSIARAWNKARTTIQGWPSATLRVPDGRTIVSRPLNDFAESFRVDLENYIASLSTCDPFSSEPRRNFAPKTIEHHKAVIRRAASLLVQSGRPIETLLSLRDLVTIEAFTTIMRAVLKRGGDRRESAYARNVGLILRSVAAHHVKADSATLKELDRRVKRIEPARGGLTPRNLERLRQFAQRDNLQRLLDLPELLMTQAESDGVPSRQAPFLAQMSVAIAIELTCPVRIKNLTSIRLGQHLSWTGAGRHRIAYVTFAPDEVKNKAGMTFELSAAAAGLIDTYVRRFRPLLCEPCCPWLFPGRAGQPKLPSNFGEQLKNTIRYWSGLDLNPHLFRHLAAKLFLDRHPGEYESVRQMLGHKSIQTTVDFYCGFEAEGAIKRFDQVISGLRTELAADPKLALRRRDRRSIRHAAA